MTARLDDPSFWMNFAFFFAFAYIVRMDFQLQVRRSDSIFRALRLPLLFFGLPLLPVLIAAAAMPSPTAALGLWSAWCEILMVFLPGATLTILLAHQGIEVVAAAVSPRMPARWKRVAVRLPSITRTVTFLIVGVSLSAGVQVLSRSMEPVGFLVVVGAATLMAKLAYKAVAEARARDESTPALSEKATTPIPT